MRKMAVLICLLVSCICMAEEKNWIEQKFGKELIDAQGKVHKTSELKNKLVGIYFSAHWCPPCRAFTPKLVEFRDACAKEGFEIVFVSFDKSKADMDKYMSETKMKWLAAPFGGQTANALRKEYDIHSIPTLLVLDKNGKVISNKAREEVMQDGKKALEKWRKK